MAASGLNLISVSKSGASAGFLELPAQRREQAHVVEQRGAQFFDHATLQIDAGAQRFVNALEALLDAGIRSGEPLLQPGQIHARSHQQAAQFIVQLARQSSLFLL
jgi:hypothetical protein